jgi:hypothetical protein
MRLGHAMLTRRISRLALLGADSTAASQALLQLRRYFVASSFFERIGATAEDYDGADHD